jgi:hypothetical protein
MSIVEGISIILTPVTTLMGLFEGIGNFVGKMLDDMKGVGKVLKALINLTIIYAAIKSFSALAGIPYVGPILGAAAAATVLSTGYGIVNSQKMEDGLSTAKGGGGYGKRMLYDEGELFALNNKDNVLVTTNPIQANDMFSSGEYAGAMLPIGGNFVLTTMMKKISDRFDKMQPQGAVIQTSVNIDGQVAGRSLEVAKYKTSA